MPQKNSDGLRAGQLFAGLAILAATLFALGIGLIAFDQQQVLSSAKRMQEQTLPLMLSQQRLARNLERLDQEGENVFTSTSPEGRQQALFMAKLIASHPGISEDARAQKLADQAQRLLQDTVKRAEVSATVLSKNREAWSLLSRQLGLLVDDIFSESISLASSDLNTVSEAMRSARHKLLLVLPIFITSLMLLIWLISRLLVKPLQHIDRALLQLHTSKITPAPISSPLREITAVQKAISELHELLWEKEKARANFEELASQDELTGLMNRRKFMEMAEVELKRDHRHDRPVVVAMADIDFFKTVNDTHGHAAGDQVLQMLATLLKKNLRETDLVGRIGGEEFAFILPEISMDDATLLMNRIRSLFSKQVIALATGADLQATISIGISDASETSLEVALRRADEALYAAKFQGRNQVVKHTINRTPPSKATQDLPNIHT